MCKIVNGVIAKLTRRGRRDNDDDQPFLACIEDAVGRVGHNSWMSFRVGCRGFTARRRHDVRLMIDSREQVVIPWW